MLRSKRARFFAFLVVAATVSPAWSAELRRVDVIPLGSVQGRIDHLAVDVAGQRLFVAELGNGTVSTIDLTRLTVLQRAGGLPSPQGLAFLPATNALYVATGNDGKLRVFSAEDLGLHNTIDIGLDADNVVANVAGTLVAVGYVDGVALIDTSDGTKRSVPLDGHAEGMAFLPGETTLAVNVPNGREVVLVDVAAGAVTARWPTGEPGINYRVAVDAVAGAVLVGMRSPEALGVYAIEDGAHLATLPLCADIDDLFVDEGRGLVHAICGDGQIMTFSRGGAARAYAVSGITPTAPRARTGLFVPELDRLFVAVPAGADQAAEIWVFETVD